MFDSEGEIGGQFNMAKLVPGKEEFFETLRSKPSTLLNPKLQTLNHNLD